MKNIRIVVTDNNTIVVKADTKRFGTDAIMYEGSTFMQCCDYIRRVTGRNDFRLESYPMVEAFTDPDGWTMPWLMSVELGK